MNFREVRDKLGEVVGSDPENPHPAFVETRTYRYRGHSMSHPASYRTKQELETYRLDDPITRLRAQLATRRKLTNEQFDGLDKQAKEAAHAQSEIRRDKSGAVRSKNFTITLVRLQR